MTDRERTRYEEAKLAHAALIKVYPLTLDDLDGEIWRDIHGYVGLYQISNFGRTKSFCKGKVKILKPRVDKNGYLQVTLSRGEQHKVHRLVALAFIPNPNNKPQVNHVFGNKMDNYVGNLEWNTPTENNRHAIRIGLRKSGEDYPNARLTNEQVAWCRKVHIPFDKEFGITALANKFGVSESCMNDILHCKIDIKLDDEIVKRLEAPYVPHIKTGAF